MKSWQLLIGFDMEWNVNTQPGNARQGKTAIVAIAFENYIFILQVIQLMEKFLQD